MRGDVWPDEEGDSLVRDWHRENLSILVVSIVQEGPRALRTRMGLIACDLGQLDFSCLDELKEATDERYFLVDRRLGADQRVLNNADDNGKEKESDQSSADCKQRMS